MSDTVYIVSVDTRGMPSADLDGYEEITCSREYFNRRILGRKNLVCLRSHVADLCGLQKGLKVYFHEHQRGQDERGSWTDFFPMQQNNPGATLLTFNPLTGYADYNIQGIAYVVYDDGSYPLSKEQVWGIQQLANEAKDLYFYDRQHAGRGRRDLNRWCKLYKRRQWGSDYVYEPRKIDKPHRYGERVCFSETCLI